jgi:type I restriction-modification system DNA methylase subunit
MSLTFNLAQTSINQLVKHFQTNLALFRAPTYKEAQARQEFIDRMFVYLGWDVYNEERAAPQYREVEVEPSQDVEGEKRAPDYVFRIGSERKFFVEAKKPGVLIKSDARPAYQVRRYAWSAKLPLSLLTDFEELAVYDCRTRPFAKDQPSVARINFYTFDQYPDRWREIWEVFSREAVRGGSFDQYVEQAKGKRGTATVDAEFLKEIEGWREALARNLALRNAWLSIDELNDAVQRTIDRIIFLRMAEDRGIEATDRLKSAAEHNNIYAELLRLFQQADAKYNSGLFDFAADQLTAKLSIDDKVLKPIIADLYYPNPYEFSVMPAEILGNVYEQFLGKVIRLTAAHQAKVEEKPEVKKAGGVYYTPAYIVDYIVKQTVGKVIDGKSPRQLESVRVLDMACGSGSFLLGAYQFLLDYYLKWYLEHEPQKHPKAVTKIGEAWRLTTAERKRILLAHIYGVDIDRQAVEVTKLSLLLKVLEGENEQSLQMELFARERALPNLDRNIKCGNSLIGPDYFDGQLMPDPEEYRRVNPFDWRSEFPQVFGPPSNSPRSPKARTGGAPAPSPVDSFSSTGEGWGGGQGFDVIIGNPPYIRIQTMKEWAPLEVEAYKQLCTSASAGNYDIYVVFVEKALSLLNQHGKLGYILPHKFFNAQYGAALRGLIAQGQHLSHVVHFGDQQVFAGATTYTCLMFLDKAKAETCHFVKAADLAAWRISDTAQAGDIPAERITAAEWNFATGEGAALFERLSKMKPQLGDLARIFQGLVTGADKVFVLAQSEHAKKSLVEVVDQEGTSWMLERYILKPFIYGSTVATYERPSMKHWIVFPYDVQGGKATLIPAKTMAADYPRAWEYLKHYGQALRGREGGKWNHEQWYAFGRTQNLTQMNDPKLIVQVISPYGRYAYDETGIYFTGGGNGPYYGVRWLASDNAESLHYLQAVLSSRLLDWYLRRVSSPFRGGYWSYGKRFIEQLPIRTIDFTDAADKTRHDRMVALVDKMLALHQQLPAAHTAHDRDLIQRQIDATDRAIDALVYELYGLTEEEIKIVEE